MKHFYAILILSSLSIHLNAQIDTVSVMHYNLMYFGAYNSRCTASNNAQSDKEGYMRTIVHYAKPDIFTVNEMGTSGFGAKADDIKSNVMNQYGVNHYERVYLNVSGSSDLMNGIFYNSQLFGYDSKTSISSSPRNIDVVRLYYKTTDIATNPDTIFLNCIIAHFKAGSQSSDISARTSAANDVATFVQNNYTAKDNFIFMGDLNIGASSEPAWSAITNNSNSPAIKDPWFVSSWSGSRNAYMHTQSTRTSGNCFSGGGMDDRFDVMLTSQSILNGNYGLKYLKMEAYGNDAKRYNESLTSFTSPNTSKPDSVITALFNNSDHLPVLMELEVAQFTPTPTSLQEKQTTHRPFRAVNPSKSNIQIHLLEPMPEFNLTIYRIDGSVVYQEKIGALAENHVITIEKPLASGAYIVEGSKGGVPFRQQVIVQ